jgi:asparagine synthase (glutamine-hydrolysing)
MWAFCFYDRLVKKAILARDRFGKKPLFWTSTTEGLVFGSEMKALTPFMPSVVPPPDIDQMLQNLFSYESSTRCVIEGVNRIPAGHYALWYQGSLELRRWWCTLDYLMDVPTTYENQVEEFRQRFFDSVAIRMRADVKIGTALSGGLDSSSVLSTMSKIAQGHQESERTAQNWQNAYCSSFPGSSNDETAWAQRVADGLGLPLKRVITDPSSSFWSLRKSIWQTEDPYLTPPMPHLEAYRAMAQDGVKVTVDGHGADELFSGYGHLAAGVSLARIDETHDVLQVMRGMSYGDATSGLSAIGRTLSSFLGAYARKAKWTLLETPRFSDAQHALFKELSPLSKKLYEIFHVTILPTLLRNYDRYSMANGVEIRMPFMDHRLVTYVFSLPDSAKYGNGFSKRILRDSMKGILDETVRTRKQKVGWNAPVQDWLRGSLLAEVQNLSVLGGLSKKNQNLLTAFAKEANPTYKEGERMYRTVLPAIWRAIIFD